MSGKVEATFHGAEPDPQTAQQLAVARAYVARVNECPYQHTHTSLYCSKCGWFAESPIIALVAEVDRLTASAKRLSEAEMAAELYRAEWSILHCRTESHGLLKQAYGICGFGAIPDTDLAKVDTVRRFATYPHHDAA